MKSAAPSVSELAFRAFIRSYGLLRREMAPYFARFEISGAQWGVLRALHRAEAEGLPSLRLTDIGRRVLVRPPSVTGLVDRLERSGLVSRSATAVDQRAKEVRLTAAGRALLAQVLEHHPEQIRRVLAGLSVAEQRQLHRLMEKLAQHLESLPRNKGRRARPGPDGPTDAMEAFKS